MQETTSEYRIYPQYWESAQIDSLNDKKEIVKYDAWTLTIMNAQVELNNKNIMIIFFKKNLFNIEERRYRVISMYFTRWGSHWACSFCEAES